MVCFIPGCKSGNSNKVKTHLFRINKKATAETRKKWLQLIPKQKSKTFDLSKHQLCYKHFDDKYLDKFLTVTMKDTVVSQVPRKNWLLTIDAVPTKFSNEVVPKYYDKENRTRPPPRVRESKRSTTSKGAEASTILKPIHNIISSNTPGISQEDDKPSLTIPMAPSTFLVDQAVLPRNRFLAKGPGKLNCKICKLIEGNEQNFPTFISEITIKLSEPSQVDVFVRQTPILSPEVSVTNAAELEHLIMKLDETPLCQGTNALNRPIPINAYQFGMKFFSNDCCGMFNGVCAACLEMNRVAKKVQRSFQRKLRLADKIASKRNNWKTTLQKIRRLKSTNSRLHSSLREMNLKLRELNCSSLEIEVAKNGNLSSMFKEALINAVKLSKTKSKHSMRYTSNWLLQSLLLKIVSPKCYRHLRDNAVLPLPHPNHITAMLKGLPAQFGFNSFVLHQLGKQFSSLERHNKQFIILFDEMKVRESISFNKSTMQFDGYIDYGEFEAPTRKKGSHSEADHALVFMCRCLNSNLTQPLASFATKGAAPGNILAKIIISCIIRLEEVGCEVVGVVSDGAMSNKSAWNILGISGKLNRMNNKIINPVDETRSVYFICDMPHVIKCIRNNFYKKTTALFDGKMINWDFYRALYEEESKSDLRTAHRLTINHIAPGPFQKMVVSYATQIFSNSVASSLELYRTKSTEFHSKIFQHSEQTELFTKRINDLFDACNTRQPAEGLKPNSKDYKIIKDFLNNHLADGNTYAAECTLESLRVSLQSILDLIDYLCNVVQFKYVLTAKLNQDCLEKFFGLVRSFGGDDCHPTIQNFSHLFRLLSMFMPTAKCLKGNIQTDEDYAVVDYVESLKCLRRQKQIKAANQKKELEEILLDKLVEQEQNDEEVIEIDSALILSNIEYYLCGFLVFKAKSFTKCQSCIISLVDENSDKDCKKLQAFLNIKNRGGLMYPSMSLFKLISNYVEPKIKAMLEVKKDPTFVQNLLKSFDHFTGTGVGCCEHREGLIVKLVLYYITIRLFFYSRNENREKLGSSNRHQIKMKQANLI